MQPRATSQGFPFKTCSKRAAGCRAAACANEKEAVMAKRKGNKEARKPKQNKEKTLEIGSVSELMPRASKPGKRR